MLREWFNRKNKQNMDVSIFGSEPPTHPPNMDRTKKDMLFFGLFSSFGTKKFFKKFKGRYALCQGLVKGAKLCLNPYFFSLLEK